MIRTVFSAPPRVLKLLHSAESSELVMVEPHSSTDFYFFHFNGWFIAYSELRQEVRAVTSKRSADLT